MSIAMASSTVALASLLLFQAVAAYGATERSFAHIARQLKASELFRYPPVTDDIFDAQVLSNLFLRHLREEANRDRDVQRPGEGSSLIIDTIEDALPMLHLMPRITTRLYEQYREKVTNELLHDERQYEGILETSGSLEQHLALHRPVSLSNLPGSEEGISVELLKPVPDESSLQSIELQNGLHGGHEAKSSHGSSLVSSLEGDSCIPLDKADNPNNTRPELTDVTEYTEEHALDLLGAQRLASSPPVRILGSRTRTIVDKSSVISSAPERIQTIPHDPPDQTNLILDEPFTIPRGSATRASTSVSTLPSTSMHLSSERQQQQQSQQPHQSHQTRLASKSPSHSFAHTSAQGLRDVQSIQSPTTRLLAGATHVQRSSLEDKDVSLEDANLSTKSVPDLLAGSHTVLADGLDATNGQEQLIHAYKSQTALDIAQKSSNVDVYFSPGSSTGWKGPIKSEKLRPRSISPVSDIELEAVLSSHRSLVRDSTETSESTSTSMDHKTSSLRAADRDTSVDAIGRVKYVKRQPVATPDALKQKPFLTTVAMKRERVENGLNPLRQSVRVDPPALHGEKITRESKRKRQASKVEMPPKKRQVPLAVARAYSLTGVISVHRNFQRMTIPLMDQIASDKHASLFANPVTARTHGYYDSILQPTDLKTIRVQIAAGTRAVAAAAAIGPGSPGRSGFPSSDGGSSTTFAQSEELQPPRSIVNASQLEQELLRMFANAVMFNEGDQGVVADTREMFANAYTAITQWRGAEVGGYEATEPDLPLKRRRG